MADDSKDDGAQPPDDGTAEGGPGEELTVEDILAAASDDGQAADDAVSVLQASLEERTRDLQRVTAEFQNYRKRVERDRARTGELATAGVLKGLLPVLDDLDRAREHGDLNGPFASVADQLAGALAKHGLEPFGDKGDAFDPQIHEAVAHMQMPNLDGPTCIDVMRKGYRLGDHLLRPALVAVADPSDEPEEAEEPEIVEAEAVVGGAVVGGAVETEADEAAEAEEVEAESAAAEGGEAEVVEAEFEEDEVEEAQAELTEPDAEEAPAKAEPEGRKKKRK